MEFRVLGLGHQLLRDLVVSICIYNPYNDTERSEVSTPMTPVSRISLGKGQNLQCEFLAFCDGNKPTKLLQG